MILYIILLATIFPCTLQTSHQQIPSLQALCLESKTDFSEDIKLGDWYAEYLHNHIYCKSVTQVNPLQKKYGPNSSNISHLFLPYLEKKDKRDLNICSDDAFTNNRYSLYELAVKNKSISVINFLLDAGIDINDLRDDHLLSHISELNLTVQQVKKYITKGAVINGANKFRITPLHSAAEYPEKLKLLLDHGACVSIQNNEGNTPLHLAAKIPESVELLLAAGANAQTTNKIQQTPLHRAANNPESIRLLAQSGVDINARDRQQKTPLHKSYNPDAIKTLIKLGANINAQDNQDKTALHDLVNHALIGIYDTYIEIIEKLEKQPDYAPAIYQLITLGINTNLKNSNGEKAFDLFKVREQQYKSDLSKEKIKKAKKLKTTFEDALQKLETQQIAQKLAEIYLDNKK